MTLRTRQFLVSRLAGRILIRVAALLTLERMPPFVSASALVMRDGDVLTVMDPASRQPVLPGGHLKWRENPADAVVREVREETGYTVAPERILGAVSGLDWAGELGVVRIIYLAKIVSGELCSSAEGPAIWAPADLIEKSAGRDSRVIQLWRDHEVRD